MINCVYLYAIVSQNRDSVTRAKCKTNMTYQMIFLQKDIPLKSYVKLVETDCLSTMAFFFIN